MQSPYAVREKIWGVARPYIPNVKSMHQMPIGTLVVACTPHLGDIDASISIEIGADVIDAMSACVDPQREAAILCNIDRIVCDRVPALMSARLGYSDFVINIGHEALNA